MGTAKIDRTSVWLHDRHLPEFSSLTTDIACDVCVVGAGIAGISTAYLLAKGGQSVVLIDDGTILSGQTQVTTAHVSNVFDDRFTTIERTHGKDRTRLATEALSAALHKISSIVEQEQIDCDFKSVDAYLFLDPTHDQSELDQEYEAARRTGLVAVSRVERAPLSVYETGPCLRYQGQAQFHPLKYLIALVEAFQKLGGQVFDSSHASKITGGEHAVVETNGGSKISAKSIVVATNTPVNDRIAMHTKQAPYMSYVIAARLPLDSLPPALFWDTADPFHYVRTHRVYEPASFADGETGFHDVLIVGGEDHKTGQSNDGADRFARLETWARERFPEMQEIEHRWSGQVNESNDGLAYIGRNPLDEDNVYIATGFSGLGMTNGTLSGMILSDLILGRENPYASIFDPSRKPTSSLGEFAKENINVGLQYTKWLAPAEVSSVDDIPAGEGAIVRQGLKKIAASRSSTGQICELSAVCPHLGCMVAWNSSEKTWDCPCHGSRFSPEGEVLNGPANVNLDKKEG